MNTNLSLDVIAPAARWARRRATGRMALIEHLRRRRENEALFMSLAREADIDTEDRASAPMIPVVVGSSTKALQLSDALLRRGINADPIIFPAVPEEKARLRFFVTSCHSSEQIRFMVQVLTEELKLLNAGHPGPARKARHRYLRPQDFLKHSRKGLAGSRFR
jgi:7-keto-8-aminopelargonate synthetase-like enzyme